MIKLGLYVFGDDISCPPTCLYSVTIWVCRVFLSSLDLTSTSPTWGSSWHNVMHEGTRPYYTWRSADFTLFTYFAFCSGIRLSSRRIDAFISSIRTGICCIYRIQLVSEMMKYMAQDSNLQSSLLLFIAKADPSHDDSRVLWEAVSLLPAD